MGAALRGWFQGFPLSAPHLVGDAGAITASRWSCPGPDPGSAHVAP